jgi:hypothetical protein
MRLRRRKSRAQQAADAVGSYLTLAAVAKTAKGTAKGAKKAAKGTAAYQVAKRTPVVKGLPVLAGAIVAAFAAARLVHHGGEQGAPA